MDSLLSTVSDGFEDAAASNFLARAFSFFLLFASVFFEGTTVAEGSEVRETEFNELYYYIRIFRLTQIDVYFTFRISDIFY